MKRLLALAILAILMPSAVLAMTSEDVIRLAKAGAGDDVILSQIDSSKQVFTLTVQEILDLKSAGVSDRVITYMINSGKNRTPPGDASATPDETLGGIDQRRYERLPQSSLDDEGDDEDDDADDDDRGYHSGWGDGYNAAASFGYGGWSPFWSISLGWGYGGYYDPWYCGYWPSYWNYYSPFGCYRDYWRCPPYYVGWCDYGYPYRGDYSRHNRYYKDGRGLYDRGRAQAGSPGGSYTSNDFGRTYKGTPISRPVSHRDAYNQPAPVRSYRREPGQAPVYGGRGGSHTGNGGRSGNGSAPGYGSPPGSGTAPSRDSGRTVKPGVPPRGPAVQPPPPPAPPPGSGGSGRTLKTPPPPPQSRTLKKG